MFGYAPHLKYKRKAEHKTIIGGLFSGLIKAFLIYYIYLNILKLIVH